MTSTPPIQPRPALAFLDQHPEIGGVQVGASTLSAVARRQPTFAVERASSGAPARLVPQTSSAARLLAGPSGARLGQILLGAIGTVDARAGASRITGISLSSSHAGFTANRLLREQEEAFDVLTLPVDEQRPFVTNYLEQNTEASRTGTLAAAIDGRTLGTATIELGPEPSGDLRALAAGKLDPASDQAQWVVQVLAHELEHAVTPHDFNRGPLPKLVWLEETAATAVSGAPNGHARVAKAIGVEPRWSEDFLHVTYKRLMPTMHDLLGLAGIDVRTDEGFQRADQVLQVPRLEDVPTALAQEIARQRGLPEEIVPDIASRVADVDGDRQRVADLAAWLDDRAAAK